MNKIYLTGDKHATSIPFSYDVNFRLNVDTDETDILIVLGDFGLLWNAKPEHTEKRMAQILSSFPYQVFFVDGNHENHTRLDTLPTISRFGGEMGQYNDQIFHLKRGEIYNIYDNKFFVMGGANSIDKFHRQEHISWWRRETPSTQEFDYALANLEKHDKKVDYILSHTGPKSILTKYVKTLNESLEIEKDITSDFFEYLISNDFNISFKKWYFGHMHDNVTIDNDFELLYEDIVELGD